MDPKPSETMAGDENANESCGLCLGLLRAWQDHVFFGDVLIEKWDFMEFTKKHIWIYQQNGMNVWI
jgi:hypothetical protein